MAGSEPRPSQDFARRPWPGLLPGCLAVAGLVVLVHWPVLSAGALSFDDGLYLTENPLVQDPSWRSARRFLTEVLEPSTVRGYYQPLAMISLMLDVAASGSATDLRPFHRTSLGLHAANTLLIVLLLQALFGRAPLALAIGLLFGLHPMAVEPVAWIGERKTLLATFFALGSLLCYVAFAQRRRWGWYAGCAGLFILALLSKPTVTPLPVLLLILDYWPLRRLSGRAVLEKLPLLAIAGVAAVITIVSQGRTAVVISPTEYEPLRIPFILAHNIVFYPLKMVWPVNLSSHYAFPQPLDLAHPWIQAGVVGTLLLLAAVLVSWRWSRAPLAGWLFFLVAIFPTMGVIGFTVVIASDKYAYLPVLGFLLVLAAGAVYVDGLGVRAGRQRWVRLAAVAALALAATAEARATRAYLEVWRDSESLFRHMLRFTPDSALVLRGLANCLFGQGRFEAALEHYQWAEQSGDDPADIHGSLGATYLKLGRYAEAAEEFRVALRARPEHPAAHQGLADALAALGRADEAEAEYRTALRLKPNYPAASYNLALLVGDQNRLDEAAALYEQTLRVEPSHYKSRYNLAQILLRQGRAEEALAHLHAALQLRPELIEARIALADLLAARGQDADAAGHYRAALQADPGSPAAANNLAWLLATSTAPQVRAPAEAVQLAERAVAALPGEPTLLDTLGVAYAAAGRFDEAVATVQRAIDLAAANPELRAEMQVRLKLYQSRQAYHK